MSMRVMSSAKPVYPLDHIQSAEPGVISRDTLAFNDGVWIVVVVFFP